MMTLQLRRMPNALTSDGRAVTGAFLRCSPLECGVLVRHVSEPLISGRQLARARGGRSIQPPGQVLAAPRTQTSTAEISSGHTTMNRTSFRSSIRKKSGTAISRSRLSMCVKCARALCTRVYLTMTCVLGRASDGPGLGVERYARKNEDAVLEGRRQEFGRRACILSELQWDLD